MTKHDWSGLTKAQFTPAAKTLAERLKGQLKASPLAHLGSDYILGRLSAAAYYSALVFPQGADEHFAYAMAYFISWVFGLDEIMDNCPDIRYLDDLQTLLKAQSSLPLDAPLPLTNLQYNPQTKIEGLGLCLADFVAALNPLRRLFVEKAASAEGIVLFDTALQTQVVPAMYAEAQWRLKLAPDPDYPFYLNNGHYSICGIISADIINAFLPNPRWSRAVADKAIDALGYATRLFNDLATGFRDEAENRPSAVPLLSQTLGDKALALATVEAAIEDYCSQLERLCLPYIQAADKNDPLYFLYYYIFYCGVVSRSMYLQGDFVGLLA